MNRTQSLGVTAALALTVLVAGCGSDDTSTPDAGATPSAAPSASPSGSSSAPPSATPSAPSSAPSDEATKSAAAAVITIKDYTYELPSGLNPGDEVMIKNEDDVAHTVTSRDEGAFDVKVDGGSTAMLTVPAQAGSYDFYCTYHSNMEATLEVG